MSDPGPASEPTNGPASVTANDVARRPPREDRRALPSMIRRSQRATRLTLWGFGATLLACAVGLWWIAQLAWG